MKIQEITEKKGGYALSDAGVTRIKQKDITATIKHISQLADIPVKDLHPVGSVGKVDDSGDIDLAIDSHSFDPETVHKLLMSKLDGQGTFNKSTNVASYAIPINGDENNGKVQVDLMFTPNVEWAKFAYHSEGSNSKYKGAVRAILLSAVAAALNEPGTDHFEYDGEELVIRAGRTVELSQGLRRIFQFRPKRKDGTGYTKTMKSVSIDEFKEMFPSVEVKGGQVIIDDPAKVVKMLFGGNTTPADVRSAEQVLRLIKKKFDQETQDKIFSIAAKRSESVVNKMKLPPEILEKM